MAKHRILFNPLANNRTGKENVKAVEALFPGDLFIYKDITEIEDLYEYINDVPRDEQIIIAGGDGTLNRFINILGDRDLNCDIYYYAIGSGNDFIADLGKTKGDIIHLNPYIYNLPVVEVKGKKYRFINGVGYGIDGYCCEVGDKLRETTDKPINYAGIAIKGLLFHFKPANAKITVDGVTHTYKKVWLAPTMNGRFYGGGMMVAPDQNRLSAERKLSVVVMHGSGKIKTLIVFPNIFKGKHVEHTEMVEVLTGNDITVEFDRPTALQVDGETVLGVTSCRSLSMVPVRK